MESAVIAELAWAVTRAGHPTLRFNYRGVGGSQGRFDEGDGAYADLEKAAHHLRACLDADGDGDGRASPALALVGLGLGAHLGTRLALDDGRMSPLILLDPAIEGHTLPSMAALGDVVLIQAEHDAPIALPHARRVVVPGADRTFLRGLVNLGKIVAETLTSSGR